MQCQYEVKRKNRLCKMTVKDGERYCGQHVVFDNSVNDCQNSQKIRVVCPYDNKHSCFEKKLQKHIAVCNARPKETPAFIIPDVNRGDLNKREGIRRLADLSADELTLLIQKIESVYENYIPTIETEISNHVLLSEDIKNPTYGPNKMKHLLQNSSLLGLAEKYGLLNKNSVYIEFGAGRGQLSYYVAQIMQESDKCFLLLVDHASQRHKFDNKLKDSPMRVIRIRADIANLCLRNIPSLQEYESAVSFGKHLCGSATDFALRCMVSYENVEEEKRLPVVGIMMALCCHHRCDWGSYTGKEFMLAHGFTAEDFDVMCGIASWATCGLERSREMFVSEEHEESDGCPEEQRHTPLTLTEDERKIIGRKSKAIFNYGRQKYLEKHNYICKQIEYVNEITSPENVCILARKQNTESEK